MQGERDNLQRSSREDIFATPALNSATGQAQLTSWRTEPEIGPARQEQLARCLATIPDITRAIYPFKGMKLSRADVEWLLAAQLKDLQMIQSDDQFSSSSLEYMLTQLHAVAHAKLGRERSDQKITAQNERDLHPLFPREAAQNSLGTGGKRENQKITAQNERDLHPISGQSGNCPPWWMKAEGIAQRFRIPLVVSDPRHSLTCG